jgi:hypothetical protein
MIRIMAMRMKAMTVVAAFEIASQTAIATDPGERPLNNPSLGQDFESNGIGSLHNF